MGDPHDTDCGLLQRNKRSDTGLIRRLDNVSNDRQLEIDQVRRQQTVLHRQLPTNLGDTDESINMIRVDLSRKMKGNKYILRRRKELRRKGVRKMKGRERDVDKYKQRKRGADEPKTALFSKSCFFKRRCTNGGCLSIHLSVTPIR